MSLQTGSELARTSRAIIDPKNLEIVAYELTGQLLETKPSLLRIVDVREFSDVGIIVDSSDEFVTPADIIKLQDIYELYFSLEKKHVIDEKKHKIGHVTGYTLNTVDFMVQQMNVKRPLLKSFSDTELIIHRNQIIEINDSAVIIHSDSETPEPLLESVRTAYVNPFRKNPQAEQLRSEKS